MFLYLAFLNLVISYSRADYTIKYSAIIYRHGDRTPIDPYPTDPWGNESFWPVKFGELTNIGKMQHFKLGQWLRKRYMNLISEEFDPTAVKIRSTDVDRTLMSAQTNLAGMFPPDVKTTWNPKLSWQPIPIHTIPEVDDEVLAMEKECKLYTRIKQNHMESKAYQKRLSQYQDLMDYLTVNTGRQIRDYEDILSIYTTLKIEKSYNFTLPNWTREVFPEQMIEPACYSFTTPTATPKMAQLMIGPLMQTITKQILDVVQGHSNLKLSIYSGHDLTIGSVLNGLGVYDGNCPVYTSTIFFEVLDIGGNYSIRLSYRNSTEIIEPYVLYVPQCGEICPLENFLKLYEKIINVDWESECQDKFQMWLIIISCTILTSFIMSYFIKIRKYNLEREIYTDDFFKSRLLLNRL